MPVTHKILVSLLILFSTTLSADRLTIPGHVEGERGTEMPRRGINMDQVLAEFGEPVRRIEAIGEPPITEWDYGDFRVYFEYQTVLHSVDLTTLIMPRK